MKHFPWNKNNDDFKGVWNGKQQILKFVDKDQLKTTKHYLNGEKCTFDGPDFVTNILRCYEWLLTINGIHNNEMIALLNVHLSHCWEFLWPRSIQYLHHFIFSIYKVERKYLKNTNNNAHNRYDPLTFQGMQLVHRVVTHKCRIKVHSYAWTVNFEYQIKFHLGKMENIFQTFNDKVFVLFYPSPNFYKCI